MEQNRSRHRHLVANVPSYIRGFRHSRMLFRAFASSVVETRSRRRHFILVRRDRLGFVLVEKKGVKSKHLTFGL